MQEKAIRVVLLDEQALFRESLAQYLAAEPGIELAGQYATPGEALQALRRAPVDVVFLDYRHFGDGERGFAADARRAGFAGRFLVLAGAAGLPDAASVVQCGASGIFLKTDRAERLVEAIRMVANGAVWLDQSVIRVMAEHVSELGKQQDEAQPLHLSEREQKVLAGIMAGLTNRRIGDQIGISEGSVKMTVQQLLARAGVRSRSQLVRAALEGSLGVVTQYGV